ncbi:MAG: pyridoxamine 5'-phosphate oxidase family protein [Chromatiales bacterium]|jgi:putative heme iron utilization protein
MKQQQEAPLHHEILAFRDRFRTLTLATTSANQQPEASVAPFVISDHGNICVFISELAQHTRNLLNGSKASLLLVADEADSRNLFARQRLTLRASAFEIQRSAPDWHSIMSQFRQRFDGTIDILKQLPDFHLFGFAVNSANYVQGFGQAFELDQDLRPLQLEQ